MNHCKTFAFFAIILALLVLAALHAQPVQAQTSAHDDSKDSAIDDSGHEKQEDDGDQSDDTKKDGGGQDAGQTAQPTQTNQTAQTNQTTQGTKDSGGQDTQTGNENTAGEQTPGQTNQDSKDGDLENGGQDTQTGKNETDTQPPGQTQQPGPAPQTNQTNQDTTDNGQDGNNGSDDGTDNGGDDNSGEDNGDDDDEDDSCYGLKKQHDGVCSGKGECIRGKCRCRHPWKGTKCDQCETGYSLVNGKCQPLCFDKTANDDQVCSGNGRCVLPDTCLCHSGWQGQKCDEPCATCPTGFVGLPPNNCIPVCFAIPANDTTVCSERGRCIAPDTCQCNGGFSGDRCQDTIPPQCNIGFTLINGQCLPVCFGKPSNDPRVCSGNGTCILPNTCICNSGFEGRQCDRQVLTCPVGFVKVKDECIARCFGLLATDDQVCSGRGRCIAPNTCQCDGGFSGNRCQDSIPPQCNAGFTLENGLCVPVCFGISSRDSSVCSGRGNCTSPNTCICNPGFQGLQCEQVVVTCPQGFAKINNQCFPVCFDLPATDSRVCSGNGRCIAPDTCQCDGGFSGDECQNVSCPEGFRLLNSQCFPVCFTQVSTDPNVCSGRGFCIAPDTCQCLAGFSGDRCQNMTCNPGFQLVSNRCVAVCFSQLATDMNVCSGRGRCVAPDTCQCNAGFTGDRCQDTIPPPTCSNGFQLVNNQCVALCFSQLANDVNVCSGRGRCIAPNTCQCDGGFTGQRCELTIPQPPTCSNGFQLVNNQCVALCFSQLATDMNVCSGRGRCVAPDTCQCDAGFMGDRCQDTIPLPPTCSNGFQLVNNQCVALCFSQLATDVNVCSGQGRCIAPDVCLCNTGFTGDRCQNSTLPPAPPAPPSCENGFILVNNECLAVCFNLDANDAQVCSGHGLCIAPDQCQCTFPWKGSMCDVRCEETFCFGLSSSNASVCSEHGVCVASNTCKCIEPWTGMKCESRGIPAACDAGYTGPDCTIPICQGLAATNPLVCSGSGTCVSPDKCQCLDGFEGLLCQVTSPESGASSSSMGICIVMAIALILSTLQVLFNH